MSRRPKRRRTHTSGPSFTWTIDDILERLAERAFNHVSEGLGIRFCPRDHIPMVRLPSGFFFCPTCEVKYTAPANERARAGEDLGEDAFRPFSPFGNPFQQRDRWADRYANRFGEGEPPRPYARPAPPPRRAVEADPIEAAYRELDLKPPATRADVKKRRRDLAMTLHPDHGGDGKKLARVNAAADLLLEVL